MTATTPRLVELGAVGLTDIVRYAGASGDFNPLHHDAAVGRAAGHGGVISMGMLHGGWVLSELLAGPRSRPMPATMPIITRLRFTGVVRLGEPLVAEVLGDGSVVRGELTAAGRAVVTAEVAYDVTAEVAPRGGAEVHTAEFPIERGAVRRFAEAVRWPLSVDEGEPVPPTFLATVSGWLPVHDPIARAGFDPGRTLHGESEVALPGGPLLVGESFSVDEFVAGRRVVNGRRGPMTVVDVVAELRDSSCLRAVYRTTLLETPPACAAPQSHPPTLRGSRDPRTGESFYPERKLSVDGTLRPCEPVELSATGVLWSWTTYDGQAYGQVDLPEGVRLQARLGDGEHRIGDAYRLAGTSEQDWWFDRA